MIIGNGTLLNGDCLELMKQIPDKSIDLILTDPPYEHDIHGGKGKTDFAQRQLVKDKHINFISKGFDYEKVFCEFLRLCKTVNILCFCSNKQISKTMSFFENKKLSTTLLIWKKTNPIPFGNGKHVSDIEFVVYVRGKKAPFNNETPINLKKKVKKFPTISSKNRTHPTEKPIALLEEYLKLHSNKNDLILDSFSGSGTTAIAAERNNRRWICIEKDPEYYWGSAARIAQELNL